VFDYHHARRNCFLLGISAVFLGALIRTDFKLLGEIRIGPLPRSGGHF